MQTVRLIAIKYGCDFRKTERTLFAEFAADKKYRHLLPLKSTEVLLFVSGGEDQLIWILPVPGLALKNARGAPIQLTDSRRWRITGGTWSPSLLGDYARACGLELVGIRLFKEAFEDERSRRRQARTLDDYVYEPHTHLKSLEA